MVEQAKKPGEVRLKVKANLLERQGVEELPKGMAYAFSSGGRLLDQKTLDKEGQATLAFPAVKEARSIRVMVGPEYEAPSISELFRRGAEGKMLRIDPKDLAPSITIDVIPKKWLCWLLSLCFVRGTLLKRVELEGIAVDLPVCHATVEVYEVDPFFLFVKRLPDTIIEQIRDIIREIPPQPIPWPPPPVELVRPFPPPPSPGPPPLAGTGLESIGPEMAATTPGKGASLGEMAFQATFGGAADLQFLAQTTNTLQFRNVLVDYADIVRPILCKYFPIAPFVKKRLVAVARTDECGRFQTFFFRGCDNPDTPDLYFIAKQRLFGFFTVTIYEPTPVACHTYWDYECGTEVTLYTTHPLARTCLPCPPVIAPNNWVLVMAVGNHPLSRIYGTSPALQAATTPENLGLTDAGEPFGDLLRLRIEFDSSLREDLEVKYYKVSYRQGTSGDFQDLTDPVWRHYTYEDGGDLVLKLWPNNPRDVGPSKNLFEIPPALPPHGWWSFPDLTEDLTSAKFPTKVKAPAAEHGKYQIKVDLFDELGNPVNIVAKDIKFRVPAVTDLSGDIDTADAATLGLVVGNSFIMTLHLDNNACSAGIAAPTLDGTPASPGCGVLEYDPDAPGTVTMNYTATHPQGFARYRFELYRGATLLTPPSTSPWPGEEVGAGSFSVSPATSYLLGGCTVAGFSENVHVWAKATNGWRRLWEYDARAVRAFVLAPKSKK